MSFNFNNKYDRNDFLRFLRNDFLKDFFDEKIEQTSINNKIFNKITKLWVCEKLNNLIVLEIEHNSKNDARITITKELFKLLKQYDLNGETYKNALVIFINKESSQYRFSLLTTTYNEDYEEKLSNPKRFSFLLWPNEKVKTVKEFLEKKWSIEDFDDLVKRFDVEVVRKEFFNNYLDLYIRLYREIIKDEEFAKNLKTQSIDLVSFTKTLLWKIIFLYFIQKKGWLWVEKNGEYWKNWDKDFMRNLWNDFKNNTEKTVWEKTWFFYNDYLEHLFYEWLNKDNRQENDLNNYFNFKVPYLNWGLFKKDYENWNTNRAHISNEIFSNTKQTGILDIFDTYNFTIDEDDLYDKEVAIDPEMLWKIFEKMISISEENIWKILEEFNKNEESWKKAKLEIDNVLNKKLGAFYTPREIVHYMTKESLIAYLVNNLKWKKEGNEIKIRKVFDYKEKFLTIHEVNLEKEFNEVWEIIEDVIDKLDKIKILDPAIWSWAFPMWLLHEIYTLKYYIFDVFYREFNMFWNKEVKDFIWEDEKISVYKIKKNIIQDNIYWVDISPWAIDIARLRFWLSLVVDEETPEPLPNFEFKFVCANTLIPLDEEHSLWEDLELKNKLESIRNKYYGEDKRINKNKQKEDYYKLIWKDEKWFQKLWLLDSKRLLQLKDYDPFLWNKSCSFFDSDLMLWVDKFDIVIWNPPYWVSIKWEYRKKLEKYLDKVPDFEIYYYFIEIAYKFLKDKWVKSYIIPNTVIFNVFAENYRNKILENWWVEELLDCTNFEIFENATVRNIITLFSKNNSSKYLWYRNTKNISNFYDLVKNKKEFILSTELNNKNWWLSFKLDKKVSEILSKIVKNSWKVIDFFESSQWYIPYRRSDLINNYWEIEWNNIIDNKLWHSNNCKDESYKKEILWRDLYPFWYYEATWEYIKYWKHLACYVDEKFFNQERILVREITNPKIYSSYVKDFFVNNPSIITTIKREWENLDLKYLLWFLNSKLATFYHFNSSPKATKWAFPKILVTDIKNFPIKKISSESQKPFVEKVDKILEITKQPFYDPKKPPKEQKDLEDEIDIMVYDLYGLSEEEMRVVEESLV